MAFKMKNTSMAKLAKEAGNNRVSPIKAKEKFKVKRGDKDFLTDKQKEVIQKRIQDQRKDDYDRGPGIKGDPYKDRDKGQKAISGLAYDPSKGEFYHSGSGGGSVRVTVKGKKPKKGEMASLQTSDRTNLRDIKKVKVQSGKGKRKQTTKIKYNKDGSIKRVSNRSGRLGLKKGRGVRVGVSGAVSGEGKRESGVVRGQAAAEKIIEKRADNRIRGKKSKRKGGEA